MKFEVGKLYKMAENLNIFTCVFAEEHPTYGPFVVLFNQGGHLAGYVQDLEQNGLGLVEYKPPVIHKRYVTWYRYNKEVRSVWSTEPPCTAYSTFLQCNEVTYEEK